MNTLTTPTSACCADCATADTETALAIPCTLGSVDFKDRVDDIRSLSRRSLRRAERRPLSLTLIYEAETLSKVTDLVAKESECCSFLTFDIAGDAGSVRLTITAPVQALSAADELFAHFAPELAREAA